MKDFSDGASSKEPIVNASRRKKNWFYPRVGNIPWRWAQQPTLVFLPGESHGQRNLVVYSPYSLKGLDMTEVT